MDVGGLMVYCWKCGAENDDKAVNCGSCGAPLYPSTRREHRRRYEDELCFGPSRGFSLIGVFFGILIILAGVISLLEGVVWWASWRRLWPFVVILLGLIIIVNSLRR